jgi:hypothetical protein
MARPVFKKQVFVSYSKQPPENAQFAQELAQMLRHSGFEVWLDDERISAATDFEQAIRKGIEDSQLGLFVVTRRWLDRDFTRFELKLFADGAARGKRLVAVRREDVGEHDLAPQLQRLHAIRWMPEDAEPEARFWEIYCGLSDRPPGPRPEWAHQGRLLLGQGPPPAVEPPARPRPGPEPGDEPRWLACPARPVLAVPGRELTLLLGETGQAFSLRRPGGEALEPLADLRACSCAAECDGELVVGSFDGMLAGSRDGSWEFRAADAPILALAPARPLVALGDAGGDVTFRDRRGDAVAVAHCGGAVVELCPFDGGVVALGDDGSLTRIATPERGEAEAVADAAGVPVPREFGRPAGLFGFPSSPRVGVFSADRVGLLDGLTRRFTTGQAVVADGIRSALPLARNTGPFGVLTDAGALFLLENDLKATRPVNLLGEAREVAGIGRAPGGWLLAWTVGGTLFAVSRDRAIRKLAAEGVALAFADPEQPDQLTAVRWDVHKGVQFQPLRPELAR